MDKYRNPIAQLQDEIKHLNAVIRLYEKAAYDVQCLSPLDLADRQHEQYWAGIGLSEARIILGEAQSKISVLIELREIPESGLVSD